MSAEVNPNEQQKTKRRGPDPRFVWGLVAVVILGGILYAGYTQLNELSAQLAQKQQKLDNSVSKDEYKKLEKQLQNEKASNADLEKQVAELQKEKEKLQSQIDSFVDENNKRKEAESHDLSIPGKEAGERKTIVIEGVEFAFRWCPPGTFTMGSPEDEEGRFSDETQHKVTLTKGFWMMETEVTQKQWKAVMGNNPSEFKGDDLPVESVSWIDCQEFCKKCAQLGFPVQLPTEAQWEYACRAGTTEAYAGNLDEMAWYGSNSGSKTNPVGTKKPNAWDLYDMHGNVCEWCQDCYRDYPIGSVTDPTGPSSDSDPVIRGGGWHFHARHCRSAYRGSVDPGDRDFYLGFRLVRGQ